MKIFLAALAVLALAHCKTAHLPPPGEPVRTDLDERWRARIEEAEKADIGNSVIYTDPKDQLAYDAGYATGYQDRSRRKPSDPEPHLTGVEGRYRQVFMDGYTAGFAR